MIQSRKNQNFTRTLRNSQVVMKPFSPATNLGKQRGKTTCIMIQQPLSARITSPISLALLAGLVLMTSPVFADTPAEMPHAKTNAAAVQLNTANWIGVALSGIPDALRDQLGHLIPAGQGVLVANVSPDSPAFKAGIERNDVLLAYENQRLYSPAQLAGLIKSDQAGREVSMQLVKKGVLKQVKVKLAAKTAENTAWSTPRGYSIPSVPDSMSRSWQGRQPQTMPQMPGSPQGDSQTLAWDSFESVQVRTLPDGRYHAEISYKDEKNETRTFTFEGKRDEIIAQINAQIDMPPAKKQALLNALSMRPATPFNQPFGLQPGAPFDPPFLQGNPFNSPFFRNNPFDDPFFRRSPFDDPFFQHYFPPRYQPRVPSAPPNQIPLDDANPDKII